MQRRILAAAEESEGGTSALNGRIMEALRDWLAQKGLEAAAEEGAGSLLLNAVGTLLREQGRL